MRAGDPVQRVDHAVAGDVDTRRIDVLGDQRGGGGLGRREVERGDAADDLAVDLLGPGVVDIAAAQARPRRDRPESCDNRRPARRPWAVAVSPWTITRSGFSASMTWPSSTSSLAVSASRLWSGAHQVEVVIGGYAGDLQHLVEHAAMLRRDADAHFEPRVRLQRGDHREQLDRLGPRAEDDQELGGSGHGPAHYQRGVNREITPRP